MSSNTRYILWESDPDWIDDRPHSDEYNAWAFPAWSSDFKEMRDNLIRYLNKRDDGAYNFRVALNEKFVEQKAFSTFGAYVFNQETAEKIARSHPLAKLALYNFFVRLDEVHGEIPPPYRKASRPMWKGSKATRGGDSTLPQGPTEGPFWEDQKPRDPDVPPRPWHWRFDSKPALQHANPPINWHLNNQPDPFQQTRNRAIQVRQFYRGAPPAWPAQASHNYNLMGRQPQSNASIEFMRNQDSLLDRARRDRARSPAVNTFDVNKVRSNATNSSLMTFSSHSSYQHPAGDGSRWDRFVSTVQASLPMQSAGHYSYNSQDCWVEDAISPMYNQVRCVSNVGPFRAAAGWDD